MSAVIFDFDGTIANSFPVLFKVYNEMAQKRGYKIVKWEEWELIRRMSIPKALRYVGIKPYQVPSLLGTGRRQLLEKADEIEIFNGMDKVINTLSANKHKIFILSTNAKEVVLKVLKKADLDKKVHTLNTTAVFGKATAIKQLIRRYRLDKKDVWLVGDELRDIQAAAKAKVNSIAVAWGLQPADLLQQANPTKLVQKPSDFYEIFGI